MKSGEIILLDNKLDAAHMKGRGPEMYLKWSEIAERTRILTNTNRTNEDITETAEFWALRAYSIYMWHKSVCNNPRTKDDSIYGCVQSYGDSAHYDKVVKVLQLPEQLNAEPKLTPADFIATILRAKSLKMDKESIEVLLENHRKKYEEDE